METLREYREQYKALGQKTNISGAKALEAVKKKAYDLMFVKCQTEEICIEAVKRNGYALQYVKCQTEEICIEAVRQNGFALPYVKHQTEEICIEAVRQNINALKYVNSKFFEPTEEEILIQEFKTLEKKMKEKGLI